MKVQKAASVPSGKGPADQFTGTVRRDGLVAPEAPSRVMPGTVTFEPGARTHWHTHPLGQLLIVTAGRGWVQEEGGERVEVTPGDSVWFPPHVRHWHGGTATTAMSHIAVTEAENGSAVDWLDPVSDADYDPA